MSDYLTIYSVVTANQGGFLEKDKKEIEFYRTELKEWELPYKEKKGNKYQFDGEMGGYDDDECECTLEELLPLNPIDFGAELINCYEETYIFDGKISEKEFLDLNHLDEETKAEVTKNREYYPVSNIDTLRWYTEEFYKDLDSAKKAYKEEIKEFKEDSKE